MVRRMTGLWVLLLAAVASGAGGEGDWYTRVREQGLEKACEVEVARHRRGVLRDSLHVGECYYQLRRYEEGRAVFLALTGSPDRNYAAMALARAGEGSFHLGRKEEAKKVFERCLAEYPDAWLDGSVADFCRAWIEKIEGRLASPERKAEGKRVEVEDVRKEIEALKRRLRELEDLLRRLR